MILYSFRMIWSCCIIALEYKALILSYFTAEIAERTERKKNNGCSSCNLKGVCNFGLFSAGSVISVVNNLLSTVCFENSFMQ